MTELDNQWMMSKIVVSKCPKCSTFSSPIGMKKDLVLVFGCYSCGISWSNKNIINEEGQLREKIEEMRNE